MGRHGRAPPWCGGPSWHRDGPPRQSRLTGGADSDREARATPARIRPSGTNGPCGDARRRCRGRRGYASADESRAPWRDDGCSAEKSACPWPWLAPHLKSAPSPAPDRVLRRRRLTRPGDITTRRTPPSARQTVKDYAQDVPAATPCDPTDPPDTTGQAVSTRRSWRCLTSDLHLILRVAASATRLLPSFNIAEDHRRIT